MAGFFVADNPPSLVLPKALGIGFLLAGVQVLFCILLADGPTVFEKYLTLYYWDSGWYASIVNRGYINNGSTRLGEYVANVAFFPAYPLLAQGFKRIFPFLLTPVALLLTAQLACVGFWTTFVLLLDRLGLAPRRCALVILIMLCHPASYFMVVGYSESLFLMALSGFIFWESRLRDKDL